MEWDYIISLNLINLKEMSLTDCHIRFRAEETSLALFFLELMEMKEETYIGTYTALFKGLPIEIKTWNKKETELTLTIISSNIELRNLYLLTNFDSMEVEYLMRDLETLDVNEFYDTPKTHRYIYVKSKYKMVDRYVFHVETYTDLGVTKPLIEVNFDLVEELKSQDKLHHSGKFKI